MLQCVFYASVYNDLLLYKHAFLLQKDSSRKHDISTISESKTPADDTSNPNKSMSQVMSQSLDLMGDRQFKVGLIGCGHVGTMILTKLLEVSGSFNNLKLIVSTRQPHLLRPFQQEFGVDAVFNNEAIVKEADIVFVCTLPS